MTFEGGKYDENKIPCTTHCTGLIGSKSYQSYALKVCISFLMIFFNFDGFYGIYLHTYKKLCSNKYSIRLITFYFNA